MLVPSVCSGVASHHCDAGSFCSPEVAGCSPVPSSAPDGLSLCAGVDTGTEPASTLQLPCPHSLARGKSAEPSIPQART